MGLGVPVELEGRSDIGIDSHLRKPSNQSSIRLKRKGGLTPALTLKFLRSPSASFLGKKDM